MRILADDIAASSRQRGGVRQVQVFRAPNSQAQLYALGDLSDPVRQFEPIESEFFPTAEVAVEYARNHGWQVQRIEC